MNRRDFLKSSAALTVSTAVLKTGALAQVSQPAHVYDRPLHIVYADSGGITLDNSPDDLMTAFAEVTNGITALCPFFLNVTDPTPYQSIIQSVQAQNMAIIPGIGGNPSPDTPFNDSSYKTMATNHASYTKYIRFENMTGFIGLANGQAAIQEMITYCVDLGYTHIMLNPWPKDPGGSGKAARFTPLSVLDSSFNQVQLNYQKSGQYPVTKDPTNWLVNTTDVQTILDYNPSCRIVVNYESPGEHEALYWMEQNQKGSSQDAFATTVSQCKQYASIYNLHWCPPFTKIYDPLDLNTWGGIVGKLNQF